MLVQNRNFFIISMLLPFLGSALGEEATSEKTPDTEGMTFSEAATTFRDVATGCAAVVVIIFYYCTYKQQEKDHKSKERMEILEHNKYDLEIEKLKFEREKFEWSKSSALSTKKLEDIQRKSVKTALESQEVQSNTDKLFLAVKSNNLHKVKDALKLAHCDVNRQDEFGKSPIFYAITLDRKRIVTALLEKGAHIGYEDSAGNNVFHYAAKSGVSVDIYNELIKSHLLKRKQKKDFFTKKNSEGKTVLEILREENDEVASAKADRLLEEGLVNESQASFSIYVPGVQQP